ncbi:von Willebrand factor C and EGF domain-containing protein isoform X3 [Ornithorhynchus anatinus]|uniref:von Willebrand factor C and EGF domain-containing protein isoform X3 n=1 Tax=Ornithorhynchus anatinus TaxID=9258 RepID=UPI0010A78591|nr:von Willebrand factor C and EGF domain-containing protein isoform X3 [Ornithorhynchus anatinus]
MLAGLLLRAACAWLLVPGAWARAAMARKKADSFAPDRRRLGPHVCFSGFGRGCCPGWMPSLGSGQCTLPLCSYGCGSGLCVAPNVCSCRDGEQGLTCPEPPGPCGEYGCDLTCNHGGCQEVARVCPVGFSMTETAIGIRCTDIDECLTSSCEGLCVNTEGGFVCECGPGMQLSANRHSCQDTDECLGTPCQQRCKNSIGSYRCSCRTGFHLHGNRHSCVDVNECRRPSEKRVCQHSCYNTLGSFRCTCRPGFRLSADRVSCEGFPKVAPAPSALLQSLQQPPKLLLLIPDSGLPALPSGHSPPPRAPGPPPITGSRVRPLPTSALPAFSTSSFPRGPSAPSATASPSVSPQTVTGSTSPPAGLLPPSLLQAEATVTPAPPPPSVTRLSPTPSRCWHQGASREHGSHWLEPGCSQCGCQDGEVVCEVMKCEIACSHPLPIKDGGCCPTCSGCFHEGVTRAEGDVFSPPSENCTICVCLSGNVSCITPECPPGPCLTPPQSDCCSCVPAKCYFHGQTYADGAKFTGDGDGCTICTCRVAPLTTMGLSFQSDRSGPPVIPVSYASASASLFQADASVSCKRTDCVETCPHPIRIPGQCCPDCSAGCTYTGRIFYNNETFPSVLDPCLSCICLLGSVACSPVDCPIACTYPFHPEGECCPVCRDCNYEGRKVMNGQMFVLEDDPCTHCTCQLGEVSCIKITCQQACTDPSLPTGDCCFTCQDFLVAVERVPEPSPVRGKELGRSAQRAREAPGFPLGFGNCSLGAHPTSMPGPELLLLQLLLRKNLSNLATLVPTMSADSLPPPPGPGGPQTPPLVSETVHLPTRVCGGSQLPRASPEVSSTPSGPGTSYLPPASPEAPQALPGVSGTSLPPSTTPRPLEAHPAPKGHSSPNTMTTESSALSKVIRSPSKPPATSPRPIGLSQTLSRLFGPPAARPSSAPRKPTRSPSSPGESRV